METAKDILAIQRVRRAIKGLSASQQVAVLDFVQNGLRQSLFQDLRDRDVREAAEKQAYLRQHEQDALALDGPGRLQFAEPVATEG